MGKQDFDWEMLEHVVNETGKCVLLGSTFDFGRRQKSQMSREARERGLTIRYGNNELNEDESNDELYLMARGRAK
jgi:hypothetical protein